MHGTPASHAPPPPHPARRGAAVLILLCVGALAAGCSTRRTLTIASRPSGARVWVDGTDRGMTPIAVPFVHYGRFHVRLEKEGYRALAEEIVLPNRIDGYPVVDLPYELTVRNRQFQRTFDLEPMSRAPVESEVEEIRRRADAFRERTARETSEGRQPARIGR